MKKRKLLVTLVSCSLLLGGAGILASCGEGGEGGGGQVQPENEYTVTFNLNYSGAPASTTQKIKEGKKATKPVDPSRSGFTFVNWFENAAGTGSAFDFNTAITADKTLYAKWEEQGSVVPGTQYTVTFNLNYEGAPAASTQQVAEGGKATRPSNPTRSGFTFDNWYENAAGTGSAFDFNTAITANKTLYAKWTESSVTPPPTGTKSGIFTDSAVTDTHQGTTEKDASWTRYTCPIRATNTSGSGWAPYFTSTKTDNVPSDGGADGDGFYGYGGFRASYGSTLTWTINSASACEAGLYVEVSQLTGEGMLGTYYSVAYGSASTAVDVSALALVSNPEGTNLSCSNKYLFAGYINLVAGTNTVVVTRTDTAASGGCYNWWGIRLSTQSSAITAGTPAA